MIAIYETVYPRFKNRITENELEEIYTPNENELLLATKIKRNEARLCFLISLKSFQRLGRIIPLMKVPKQIIEHLSKKTRVLLTESYLEKYDISGTKRRHNNIIREYLNIKPFNLAARHLLAKSVHLAAKTKDENLDLINIAIEELIRDNHELPAFSTIERAVNRIRVSVYKSFYIQISESLDADTKSKIDGMFEYDNENNSSMWFLLKKDPSSPTISNMKILIKHLTWLQEQSFKLEVLSKIPYVKLQHFSAEAKAYDISKMKEIEPYKRYTLTLSLIYTQLANILDDLGEMFIKRMMRVHRKGKVALDDYRKKNSQITDDLIEKLRDVLVAYNTEGSEKDKFSAIQSVIDSDSENLLEKCETHVSNSGNNYYSFLWKYYKSHRVVLFEIIDKIDLNSTNQNTSLEQDIKVLIYHRNKKLDWISTSNKENKKSFDLSWIPNSWWKLIAGNIKRDEYPEQINRRYFEICIFTQIMWGLKSGDLYIKGSDKYSDYREQLISWEEYNKTIEIYGKQVNLSVEKTEFTQNLKQWLGDEIQNTNNTFNKNEFVKIINGEPVISRLKKIEYSEYKKKIDLLISEKLNKVNIIDIITDTEYWIKWTKHFGLMSGHKSKVDDPIERYLLAAFCYGCNLGPTQTIRSIEKLSRKNISWINQHHVSEEGINKAINHIINAYNHFSLPQFWGTGKRASADGTKWDLYEKNLLSEYHIRYGGYGGIGYYHVSDKYIALFSHFIPCGVWEGVHILDLLQNQDSDIQPDTIHGDTQSQNAPVFGLSYLLGINLMPRIRNWKDYTLYLPDENSKCSNISCLFSDVVNWNLIETYLPDMLRIVLSIKAGKITPSTILKKLGTYSRKNKLYQAFRELGRVVRTGYLMKYIRDIELRRNIQSATNKSEAFNGFTKWIFFGNNGIITENSRERQRKSIKYNHLVANCVIFYNVCMLTQIIQELSEEGHLITNEVLSSLSPYITHHINRYGKYKLDLNRTPEKVKYKLELSN